MFSGENMEQFYKSYWIFIENIRTEHQKMDFIRKSTENQRNVSGKNMDRFYKSSSGKNMERF